MKGSFESLIFNITLLTLSGPGGIRAQIKAIKIMMKKFKGSPKSKGSSRYTVHTMKESWTSQSVHTFNADFCHDIHEMGISKIGYF